MRVLLTNDDGIRAPGIGAMFEALVGNPIPDPPGATTRAPRNAVEVIAPLTVQSATGHGVTFHEPLMVRRERMSERMEGIAVDARPADCVKLAIANLWPEKYGAGDRPDLLISGMNAGANCGINVVYSGTVAAALEAAFLGVPAIAVSLLLGNGKPRYDVAARWARETIGRILARGVLRPHEVLSVNIPCVEEDGTGGSLPHHRPARGVVDGSRMPEVRVCAMNTHGLVDQYERRVSPGGDVYYWAAGHGLDFRGTEPGSDVEWLLKGCITVTPLMYDLTRRDGLDDLNARLGGMVR